MILAGTPWPPTHRRRLVDTFFTNTADLRTAAQEYTTNQQTAIVTYGPIADWDVSAITDMKGLFLNLNHFNSDISSWNTSGVTDMTRMFEVRAARAPSVAPYIASVGRSPRAWRLRRCHTKRHPAFRPAPRPRIVCPHLATRQSAYAFNQPVSFDTSSVTNMAQMFWVRSARTP